MRIISYIFWFVLMTIFALVLFGGLILEKLSES